MSGWQQQTVLPLEQLHAKLGLGLVNLLADGADGYAEFVRCRLDRAQPSDGFHGAKAGEVNAIEVLHFRKAKLKIRISRFF
jgi:hypothetical protein